MTTHAMGPLAGLSWLKRAINLGRHNARAVFGGAALLMVVALVPSVIQLALQSLLKPDTNGSLVIAAALTLFSIVLLPPLVGGYLRLIHASESGRPAQASDVLAPLRNRSDAVRLIGFGLLMTAIYLMVALAVIKLFGEGLIEWYLQVLALSQQGGAPDASALPALPDGFGRVLGLGSLLALFLSGVYAIGFGQVALTARSIGGAIGDGLVGTLKNLLPMLVLAVVVFLASILLGLVLGLVLGLLAVIGGLVHPALSVALVLPLYIALLVVLYVVMFGVMYYFWRDVCGEAPPPLPGDHHVAV